MKKIIITISALIFVSISGIILYNSREKTAYLEMNSIYNDFEMTKSMESEYDNVIKNRNSILDSLKSELQLMAAIKMTPQQEKVFLLKRQQFLEKSEKFEEDNEIIKQEYVNKIWTRLNGYIKQFGDENGYDFIFGANGQGTIMYAKDIKNITKEVSSFVNKRFNGVRK